ncbi:Nif3-like dinuclear metal center hexameric protein [Motiliproteus sediminis]|uniref:Nif3-like dinuclear metal center hexameric protein n=1 Tax=Motiliproteus sediminis TaxID=1468178 RepID=UPI001AEFA7DE|nr:Nif3-like dinuclear metal center hexameric protein [Motiliproteus sediminis]
MSVPLKQLLNQIDEWLQPATISDYCPNGLQVEGRSEVRRLVTGVTACQALIDAAVEAGADAVLVHHGYFWKGENPCVTGLKKRRLQSLLAADISLLAYHLPLDLHADYGNNVQLAKRLGLSVEGPLDPVARQSVGLWGQLAQPETAAAFAARVARTLAREPQLIGDPDREIRRIGWCTGAAQGYIEQAVALGLDAYVSGEISEPTVHSAREHDIAYFAVGHHASERYGVQALGDALAERFGIEHRYIEIDNPV